MAMARLLRPNPATHKQNVRTLQMNLFAAASLGSLVILLALVGLSALPAWLKKNRLQKAADGRSAEAGLQSGPASPGRSTRQFDWEDALRQLLGGQPPSPVSPPRSIRSILRDNQPASISFSEEQRTASEPAITANLPERSDLFARSFNSPTAARRLRSREGARAVALVRDSHTVRQAMIAAVILDSPKGLEA